ncbi:MAG: hypothetical protein H0X20_05300, partial [Chloroflexi bacterium]|nr:hypothetical protein [Chloroflexota bacterium]
YAGITLIGKRAQIPANVRIGRNVRIDEGVRVADFRSARTVQTGATIHHRVTRTAASQPGEAAGAGGRAASGAGRGGNTVRARATGPSIE